MPVASTLSICFLLLAPCISDKNNVSLIVRESFTRNSFRHYHTISKTANTTFPYFVYESDAFVDKSLLMRALMKDSGKVFVVTCPRRWGKSLNLNMIKTFFEIQVDDNGNQILPTPLTENYNLFVYGKSFKKENVKKFNPFLIAQHKHFIHNYLGKYPIIYLTFKDTFCVKFKNPVDDVRTAIGGAFRDNFFMSTIYFSAMNDENQDNNTREMARRRYIQFQNAVSFEKIMREDELTSSLNFLSETAYRFYKKEVIILIDEYACPWEALLADQFCPVEYKKYFFDFYTNLMAATFRDNPYLMKGILTGILPLPQELRETVFANATECNLMSGKFMEYYGFNQIEIQKWHELLSTSALMRQEMDIWYKGYHVNNRDLIIYNPTSITGYLSDKFFDSYWVKTGSLKYLIENFFKIASFRKKYDILLHNNNIVVTTHQYLTWNDYSILINASHAPIHMVESCSDKVFFYLYILGYLTLAQDYNATVHGNQRLMKIPNTEVRAALSKEIPPLDRSPTSSYPPPRSTTQYCETRVQDDRFVRRTRRTPKNQFGEFAKFFRGCNIIHSAEFRKYFT